MYAGVARSDSCEVFDGLSRRQHLPTWSMLRDSKQIDIAELPTDAAHLSGDDLEGAS